MNGGGREEGKGEEKKNGRHPEPPELPQVCSSAGGPIPSSHNLRRGPRKPIGSLFRARIGQKRGQVTSTDKLRFDSAVSGSLPEFSGSSGNTGQPGGGGSRDSLLGSTPYPGIHSPNMWMPASSSGPQTPKESGSLGAGLHPYWLAEHRGGKPKNGDADLCFHGLARRG